VENARKYLPLIVGGLVAIALFFVSRKMRKGEQTNTERSTILEKAREAKLAKSILRKTEEEDDSQSIAV
jgi:hypothetical protein